MKRLGHYPFLPSPNVDARPFTPRYLMIHYTAGRGFEQSCAWLRNPKAKASAHFVIGRAGEVAQLVGLDQAAWHAGASRLTVGSEQPLVGMNRYSFGLELDNPGPLVKSPAGWRTWYGEPWPEADVVLAPHKHGGAERGWAAYPEVQVLRAYEICEQLIDVVPGLLDVIGHDDVAPGRKLDPGPAFPLERLRGWLFGRESDEAPDFVA